MTVSYLLGFDMGTGKLFHLKNDYEGVHGEGASVCMDCKAPLPGSAEVLEALEGVWNGGEFEEDQPHA